MEQNNPGCFRLVNESLYDKNINQCREIDIKAKGCIIEVKSGKVRHKTKQFLAQIKMAKDYGLQHIVFAPDVNDMKMKELADKGVKVVRTMKEVLERVKK